jgi:hypothetical protein
LDLAGVALAAHVPNTYCSFKEALSHLGVRVGNREKEGMGSKSINTLTIRL